MYSGVFSTTKALQILEQIIQRVKVSMMHNMAARYFAAIKFPNGNVQKFTIRRVAKVIPHSGIEAIWEADVNFIFKSYSFFRIIHAGWVTQLSSDVNSP